MWPFKTKKFDTESFYDCIQVTIEKIEASEDSIWAGLSGQEVVMDLKFAVEKVKEGKEYDRGHISMLYAPTGSIQEIAIDNGWGEEFLRISSNFDKINNQPRTNQFV